jgi:hypothetical protein
MNIYPKKISFIVWGYIGMALCNCYKYWKTPISREGKRPYINLISYMPQPPEWQLQGMGL